MDVQEIRGQWHVGECGGKPRLILRRCNAPAALGDSSPDESALLESFTCGAKETILLAE